MQIAVIAAIARDRRHLDFLRSRRFRAMAAMTAIF
jgi:hypothetical protein